MKNKIIGFLILTGCIFQISYSQEKSYHDWWNDRQWTKPYQNETGKALPLITVQGNKLISSTGDTMLFRGLSISDPDKIANQGHWSREYFVKVREMGADLVRIPVHPIAWRERTPQKYIELLDQAVNWCTDLGIYIIIDWHSIGNLQMELFQDPMYNTSKKETFEFWRFIAFHFTGNHTVAFYELFNEPTHYMGTLGNLSWTEWKKLNEDMIDLIRSFDTETIPLVAGFDWAYDLNHLHYEPVMREGIGYVTHPYANKRSQPWIPKWEENFGFVADTYPVIATEIGFQLKNDVTVDENHYGNIITRYLEEKGISWLAWVFDPEWWPPMYESWDTYKLTGYGEFIKSALQRPVAD